MFYLISKDRLIRELQLNAKNKGKGVLNWFIKAEIGVIFIIYDISPTDTPIMSSIGKTKATSVNHEWQTDALAAATTSNALVEGATATEGTIAPTTRLGNLLTG